MNKIEEIAKAAYDRRFGQTKPGWSSLTSEEKGPYILDAVAFLEVIRQPTPAMMKAGADFLKEKDWPLPTGYLSGVWLKMVHAALG